MPISCVRGPFRPLTIISFPSWKHTRSSPLLMLPPSLYILASQEHVDIILPHSMPLIIPGPPLEGLDFGSEFLHNMDFWWGIQCQWWLFIPPWSGVFRGLISWWWGVWVAISLLRALFYWGRRIQSTTVGKILLKTAPTIEKVWGLPVGTLIIWHLDQFNNWPMSCLGQTDMVNIIIGFKYLFARWRGSQRCLWHGVTSVNQGCTGMHRSSVIEWSSWYCPCSIL